MFQFQLQFKRHLIILVIFSAIIGLTKQCRESPLDENIRNADVIVTGMVRRLERNYSGNSYGAHIQIHRILKGTNRLIEFKGLLNNHSLIVSRIRSRE